MSRGGENNWESCEPSEIIQVSNDNNGNSRDGMKLFCSTYILKIEPRVFAGGMDVCCKKKKRIKDDLVFGLNKWKRELP